MKTSLALAFLLAVASVTGMGCKDKGGSTSAGDTMAKMAAFRDRMCACSDAACAKQVADEMTAWTKKQPSEKPVALSDDEQKKATEIGAQLGECMMRATGLGGAATDGSATGADAAGSAAATGTGADTAGSAAGTTAPAGSASDPSTASAANAPTGTNAHGLPKECDEYKAAVEKLATCDKLAKQARETLVKGYEDAAARWATGSAEMKASLAQACKGGTEAVVSVAKTQCGW